MERTEKQFNKAKEQLNKADLLFKNKHYRKSSKVYNDAAGSFLKIFEFKFAKDCFVKAAKAYEIDHQYPSVLISLRNAGNICIYYDDFMEAHKYFNNALKYIPYLNKEKEKDFYRLLFASLSYLCYLIVGNQEQGVDIIKRVRKKVDAEIFKENSLIRLVKDLTVAVRKKNENYLQKIERESGDYKFTEAETVLVKKALVTAKSQIAIKSQLILDKDEYLTRDLINLNLLINTIPIKGISNHPFYDLEIEDLKITKFDIRLSNNLTIQDKPTLPIILKPGEEKQLGLVFKPNFQVDDTFIGPIIMTWTINDKYIFPLESDIIQVKLVSPPITLNASTKILRTPLVDKTFPMEILIENKSEGEASEINIDLEFPKQLKVMRGTITKQIYSLRMNENIKWELQIKPFEAGEYILKIIVKFKDPEQNEIEETHEYPVSIKL
ncbi:MAG: hypothetical protein ACFFBP_16090 [Promethearchaeota archaeon]